MDGRDKLGQTCFLFSPMNTNMATVYTCHAGRPAASNRHFQARTLFVILLTAHLS